jgi:5-methylcytosine-specific restriction endonuclease McrA
VRRKVVERSGNRCERCGIDFDDGFTGEFHHIVPVVYGGDDSLDNCSLLCHDCHLQAPDVKSRKDVLIYRHYFLRFASFKEAAEHYGGNNRFDLYVKIAFDIARMSRK